MLEHLTRQEAEWEEQLQQLRYVLRFAQSAPLEMRRHHSFVFESARMIDKVVDDMRWVLCEGSPIATNAHNMLNVATSAHGTLDRLLEECRDDLGDYRALVRACVQECNQVVSLAFTIRNAARSVCVQWQRVRSQLHEHAAMIRAGAQAIHDNISPTEAEDHVRRLHVDVPSDWITPREWRS